MSQRCYGEMRGIEVTTAVNAGINSTILMYFCKKIFYRSRTYAEEQGQGMTGNIGLEKHRTLFFKHGIANVKSAKQWEIWPSRRSHAFVFSPCDTNYIAMLLHWATMATITTLCPVYSRSLCPYAFQSCTLMACRHQFGLNVARLCNQLKTCALSRVSDSYLWQKILNLFRHGTAPLERQLLRC